jgi:hypothetical protein
MLALEQKTINNLVIKRKRIAAWLLPITHTKHHRTQMAEIQPKAHRKFVSRIEL